MALTFKHFLAGLIWRLALLVGLNLGLVWLSKTYGIWFFTLVVLANLLLIRTLYRYVTGMNRKLVRFFESVQYGDFAIKFRSDDSLGESFSALNAQMNKVLEAFRQAREENEANLHFIHTIIQHVNVGLFSFDAQGNIELINREALRLLGAYRLKNLRDLAQSPHQTLLRLLGPSTRSQKFLYPTPSGQQLIVHAVKVNVRGRNISLVSLQNIQPELLEKELEAWQNLARVLRHEIMNSVTPIVSLAETMKKIVDQDIPETEATHEAIADLRLALDTIGQRGKGIMQFVQAYREFTTIPKPVMERTAVEPLVQGVLTLFQDSFSGGKIRTACQFLNQELEILADPAQIEMVLINLVKNAVEAMADVPSPGLLIRAGEQEGHVFIEVTDNGKGIDPADQERIFVPFFTTKADGSGIGLSLSMQIMQHHGGNIQCFSTPGTGSRFVLNFRN